MLASNNYILLSTISCATDYPDIHSFPTRRSSDLKCPSPTNLARLGGFRKRGKSATWACRRSRWVRSSGPGRSRSEEHTSELQSRQYLVCRLLLEKKKLSNISSDYTSQALYEQLIE